jgi:hypothetical protein
VSWLRLERSIDQGKVAMNDVPLYQQCRDHSDSCEQCKTALNKAAVGYGYGQPKGCVIDDRPAIPEMCAEGARIYTARHEEMRTEKSI